MGATTGLQSQTSGISWGNIIKNKSPANPENLFTKVVEKHNSFIIK